jgi:23S rRNA pseudouridine955/2504/2580 synthase
MVIKLSAPEASGFWEIPVLYEDAHLLALNKPGALPLAPDTAAPERANLIELLHKAIAEAKPWAVNRGISFLMYAHRLDAEASGVLLLARSKAVLSKLLDLFGSERPTLSFIALARGAPIENQFSVEAKVGPHPAKPGLSRIDAMGGKRARTTFEVLERFTGWTLLKCLPLTHRPHQVRVHLGRAGLRLAGDAAYGGKPLWLSSLKPNYHLKPGHTERPLIGSAALHAEQLALAHPVTGSPLSITAPWPKDLLVALKYLRMYAA